MKKRWTFTRAFWACHSPKPLSCLGIWASTFFDIGKGDSLAFFWFPNAQESKSGVTHAAALVGQGDISSANASMNHVAFDVPEECIEEYVQKLRASGVECTEVVNHNDSETQASDVTICAFCGGSETVLNSV